MSSISLIISSLKKNQKTTFISQGNSMYPLIPNNTKITITPKKFSEVKIYDIVAIKSTKKIIIHQCLFKCPEYLVCQGVNNHFVDPPALPNQILGTVEIGNYYQTTNLVYDYKLQQIHRLAPKIPILVLKGATWQKHFYGYYLNKPSSDLDILINKSDFQLLKKALIELGFYQNQFPPKLSQVNEISFSQKINSVNLTIDLHFLAIRSPLKIKFRQPTTPLRMSELSEEFFQNSSSQNNLFYLKGEYLIFYLCLNSIFHHAVRGTDLLAHIANINASKKINWLNFWKLSNKYQCSNFVFYPLLWSSRLFKVNVPNLKKHQPEPIRHFLARFFINRITVFRPFSYLGCDFFFTYINAITIFIIRRILYDQK